MKRIMMFSMLISIAVSSSSYGAEPAVLTLDHGDNTVVLSMKNDWDRDISGVTVAVDGEAVPDWLSVTVPGTDFDMPAGPYENRLTLSITVAGAPPHSETVLPLLFEDDTGHRWRKQVPLKITDYTPSATRLHDNRPNPFNPITTIHYDLTADTHTVLTVYNAAGQTVSTLYDGMQRSGSHSVVWDGRNDSGEPVSSGVYFCRMTAGGYVKSIKMILAK